MQNLKKMSVLLVRSDGDLDCNYVHTDCILVMWRGIFTGEKNNIQNISLIYTYVPPYLHRDFTGSRDFLK